MLGRRHSGVGMARGIPRCASRYSPNGPSLCEAMCISGWDEERDKEDTATVMGSLLPLETSGGAGSCGVHQECGSPRQGMLHAASPLGSASHWPLAAGAGAKPHGRSPARLVVLRSDKGPISRCFLSWVPVRLKPMRTEQFQISGFKSKWFTFPGFKGFNLQV